MKKVYHFHWSDYLIFVLFLILYACIGIYYRFRGFFQKKLANLCQRMRPKDEASKPDVDELFLGSRKLTLLPILASNLATFTSAVSLMGINAETYFYGIHYIIFIFAYAVGYPLASELYMPVFYKLRLTSANEYLEMRFGKITRWLVSLTFVIQTMLYTALALFAPALVFAQVSGLPFWVSLVTSGAVTTLYTALGGIRAVVWTDLLQLSVMILGMLAIMITAIVKVGGGGRVWEIALEGKRLQTFILDINPFIRHSVWSLSFGGIGLIASVTCTNQIQIQRYLACKTQDTARKSILLSFLGSSIFQLIQLGMGLATYAYFHKCDPLKSHAIMFPDQMLPYTVMVIFDGVPIVRGLFLSIIFAAALSTVSSGLNGLANVIIMDLIRPIYIYKRQKDISSKRLTTMAYILALVIGLIVMAVAFAFIFSSPQIIVMSFTLFGGIGGPIFTVFTLGIFFPCINQWVVSRGSYHQDMPWLGMGRQMTTVSAIVAYLIEIGQDGAIAGLISSLIVGFWLAVGSSFFATPAYKYMLPLSTAGCDSASYTKIATSMAKTMSKASTSAASSFNFYDLSVMYFTLACFLVGCIFAVIFSAIFKFNINSPVSPKLLASQALWVCERIPSCFPTQIDYYESQTFSRTSIVDWMDERGVVDNGFKNVQFRGSDALIERDQQIR